MEPTLTRLSELPAPSAIIFDLDGTLVDTVGTRIDAWLATFAEIGLPVEREHLAGLIGADGKRLAREVAEIAERRLSDDKAEAIDRRAGEVYDKLNTDPQPVPGARSLLVALGRNDLRWAIATSSRAAQVGASVAALRLPGEPRVIDGSHVEHAKPAPDLLLLAAERLEVPARGCWYVGDSTWDMRAALAAAMVPIGVAYGAVDARQLAAAGASATATFRSLSTELRRRSLID